MIGSKLAKNAWKTKESEQEKINKAIDEFAQAMKDRMQTKRRAGWKGWDRYPLSMSIVSRLQKNVDFVTDRFEAENLLDTQILQVKKREKYLLSLVDVANFAMMFWKEKEHASND